MSRTPHLALLAYASALRAPIPRARLEPLLSMWRVANARRGITGMLICHTDSCFQVLEGFPDVIDDLYARIGRDARHHRVVRLVHQYTDRRAFGDWSMGFARASRNDIALIPTFEDFVATGTRYWQIDAPHALALVEAFRDGYWRRLIG